MEVTVDGTPDSAYDMATLLPAVHSTRSECCTCPTVESTASVSPERPQDVLVFHFQRNAPSSCRMPLQVQAALTITVRQWVYSVSGFIVRLSHAETVGHTYSLVRRGFQWFVVDDGDVFPISWEDVQRTCRGGICSEADLFVPSCSLFIEHKYCVHAAFYVCQAQAPPVMPAAADSQGPLVVEESTPAATPHDAVVGAAAMVEGAAAVLAGEAALIRAPVRPLSGFFQKWALACDPLVLWIVSRAAHVLLESGSATAGQKRRRSSTVSAVPQIVSGLWEIVSEVVVHCAACGDQADQQLLQAVSSCFSFEGDGFARSLLQRLSLPLYDCTTTLDVKQEASTDIDAGDVEPTRCAEGSMPLVVYEALLTVSRKAISELIRECPGIFACVRALGVKKDAHDAACAYVANAKLTHDTAVAFEELRRVTALVPPAPLALEVGLGVLSSCNPASGARTAFANHITVRVCVHFLVPTSFRTLSTLQRALTSIVGSVPVEFLRAIELAVQRFVGGAGCPWGRACDALMAVMRAVTNPSLVVSPRSWYLRLATALNAARERAEDAGNVTPEGQASLAYAKFVSCVILCSETLALRVH